eukprot:Phypoly_transcript_09521.p1 GENE.Phypoly_transcript_09521~~Phypoly_transcript_09521.p1  ORF type:complete len:438 (+),score=62.68 Phypoly_transcript_09521:47-1360(+)
MPMHGEVFKGLKISLDISNFAEKQKLQKLVKENGGDVSFILNKKSFVLVTTPPKDKSLSYKILSALKLGVPVVSTDYIVDSVELNQKQEVTSYLITSGDELPKETIGDIVVPPEEQKKVPIIKHDYNSPQSPHFPQEYEILKADILQNQTLFVGMELHVGGLGINEVLGSVKSDRQHERSYFRVFLHHGNTEQMDNAKMECVYASSLLNCEELYSTLYNEYETQGYQLIHLSSAAIGSEKARSSQVLSDVSSQLSTEVKELVGALYKAATTRLSGILKAPGGVTIAPEGKINSPLGQLSLDQVEKAETILLQLNEASKQKPPGPIEALQSEFFNLLPASWHRGTIDDMEQKLEDIQLMKDLLAVGEGLGSQQGLSEVDIRYRALRCDIKHLPETSQEHKTIASTVQKSIQRDAKIRVLNVYSLKRQIERDSFTTNIP